MNITVQLRREDVRFLDRYASEAGLASRSDAVRAAIRLLKGESLSAEYEAVWHEFDTQGDSSLWERTVGDGI